MKYNTYLKRIAISLELNNKEIAEIFRLGGVEMSNTRAQNLRRSSESHADREADRGHNLSSKKSGLTEAEFDAFTNGLVIWAKDNLK